MSAQTLETILSRAMSVDAFAGQFFVDTDQAIIGYDLTPDEVARLKSMGRAQFDQLAKALPEDRKSYGVILDRKRVSIPQVTQPQEEKNPCLSNPSNPYSPAP